MNKTLKGFSIYELVVMAICAAMGIAVKPLITPLFQMISGPLFIPGGALAGGIYMLFIVLGILIIKKPFAGLIICLIQSIAVITTGVIGSHGILSLFTYVAPGLAMDVAYLIFRRIDNLYTKGFVVGLCGNLMGTYASNLIFFRLPFIPLMLSLFLGALSGAIGGLIAGSIVQGLQPFIKQLEDI